MEDRDVRIVASIKASQVDESKSLVGGLDTFPTVVNNYIGLFMECIREGTPEAGHRLGALLHDCQADAEQAQKMLLRLHEIIGNPILSDPEGRKGRLQ